jgi:hypothetical protein
VWVYPPHTHTQTHMLVEGPLPCGMYLLVFTQNIRKGAGSMSEVS